MKTANRLRAALVASLLGASVPAMAVNINFEDLTETGPIAGIGATYSAKGYTFTYAPATGEPYPTSLFVVNPEYPFNGRSKALLANSCTATTHLVANDNNPFNLKSIWLAPLNGDKGGVATFLALTADNTQVRTNFVLDVSKSWKRYDFPATFKNLQIAVWVQGDCAVNPPYMIDNVRVSPTSAGKVDNDED